MFRCETVGLNTEEKDLLLAWARADHAIATKGETPALVKERAEKENELIGRGIYPGYAREDDTYTFLYG